MLYRTLADLTVALHFAFVLLVILGGFLVLRWRGLRWVHLPVAAWGILIEFAGWICPLTPLENQLRRLGGEAGYRGGFIEHYILAALYPEGLTRQTQVVLGVIVLALNGLIYRRVFARES